jgi:hypothetical protein
MSVEDIQKVVELLNLKKELRILCRSKIMSLKVDENIVSNKFWGIKYNFQNRTLVENGDFAIGPCDKFFSCKRHLQLKSK